MDQEDSTFIFAFMDLIYSIDAIDDAARKFWAKFPETRVFAFHGSMGAGKTTFIHALCKQKQVTSTVGSPTFSLINEYYSPSGRLYHLDLYRLKDEEEAQRAGVEECLYTGEICLVEWPERAPGLFPEGSVHVHIDVLTPEQRKISFGTHQI